MSTSPRADMVTYACGNVAKVGDLVNHVHRGQAVVARIQRRDGLRPDHGRPDVVAPAGEAWMFAFNCRLERRRADVAPTPLRTALTALAETLTMALVLGVLFWLLPLVAWCGR